ncbi:MAG: hypothetical protein Q8J89_01410 [Caulobacter sp.]|nr:hypothetical protein [Caulobacter sp.]
MMFIVGGTLLAIIIGLIIGSARRDRQQAAKLRVVQHRLSARYKPEQLFVSSWDQSALGLSPDRGEVVLGSAQDDAAWPITAILAVEGLRDGTVIRRVGRDDAAAPAAPSGGKGDVIRINTLDLRITVDDPARPVWTVRFFDWPAGGVSPGNVAFQAAAKDAERWFALLQQAMAAGPSKT